MNRLSISFAPPAYTWLQREAKRLGISIGELIRRLVDQSRPQAVNVPTKRATADLSPTGGDPSHNA